MGSPKFAQSEPDLKLSKKRKNKRKEDGRKKE
jgi:hypothetical protein